MVSNKAILNEEADPKMLIAKLRRQIAQLKAELAIARGEGENGDGELPEYEIERLKAWVDQYLSGTANEDILFTDLRKIKYCFNSLKNRLINSSYRSDNTPQTQVKNFDEPKSVRESKSDDPDIKKLLKLLAHRDNEISKLPFIPVEPLAIDFFKI